jgi:UDP-glucose 4-epimerase
MRILFLDCLKRVEQIVGCKITNYIVDCLDLDSLRDVFKKHSFYAIINFAALKSVGQSVEKPVLYYKNNVGALLNLLIVRFVGLLNNQ